MALTKFCYGAKVEKVVDGDTVDLSIDLCFDIHHKIRVRLYGVDTPESRTVNKAEKEAGDLFAQVLPEDFLSFGLIPEFVGRLPMVGAVHNLDKPALIKILTEPKNALLKQFQKFFEFEDVELELTEEALDAIAEQALGRGTGARGLRAILEETLLNVMYDLPGRADVAKVIIDVDSVKLKSPPTLVMRSATRVARPRRAAS